MHRLSDAVRAVIFDLDGTLYDPRKMRRLMILEMARFAIGHPGRLGDIKVLQDFRRARERNALSAVSDIENRQYFWGARTSGVPEDRVRRIIEDWMLNRPLRYLPSCRYAGIVKLFGRLKEIGIRTGVFSDYPAGKKTEALGLVPDVIVSATDVEVDRLKPDPKGLLVAAGKLETPVGQCLFVGDRDDKDGECARRAGMPYLIMERKRWKRSSESDLLTELTERFTICNG